MKKWFGVATALVLVCAASAQYPPKTLKAASCSTEGHPCVELTWTMPVQPKGVTVTGIVVSRNNEAIALLAPISLSYTDTAFKDFKPGDIEVYHLSITANMLKGTSESLPGMSVKIKP